MLSTTIHHLCTSKGNSILMHFRPATQVQAVTIAATHQDEVQTITTAAPAIVGVQLMTTSADEGDTVEGHFALQFPEIQTVTLFSTAEVTRGNFSLTYTSMWADDSTGALSSTAETTACIDWNAGAEDVSTVPICLILIQ